MNVNIEQILAIVQEVSKILQALEGMGLKVNGTVDLPTVIDLFKPRA